MKKVLFLGAALLALTACGGEEKASSETTERIVAPSAAAKAELGAFGVVTDDIEDVQRQLGALGRGPAGAPGGRTAGGQESVAATTEGTPGVDGPAAAGEEEGRA